MEVIAVTKARALMMIELDGLSNRGKIRLSDCIQPLVQRYDFQRFPTKPEDFDLADKGVEFASGKALGVTIDLLKIFDGALVLDTLSSTDDSKSILYDLLEWGKRELGLTFNEKLIRRWGYVNQVVFKSDIPLLNPKDSPMQKLASKTSAFTEGNFEGLKYLPSQIMIGHDPALRKHSIASLFITHRVNTSYSGKEFFSEAPLPTHLHIKYLEEFEQDVKDQLV